MVGGRWRIIGRLVMIVVLFVVVFGCCFLAWWVRDKGQVREVYVPVPARIVISLSAHSISISI